MDTSQGEADAGRWMNYAEIAALRRISKASAERLVRRRRWRKQVDNRGVARAYIPEEWCTAPPPADTRADVRRDGRGAAYIPAFEAALTALREQQTALQEQQAHERAAWEHDRIAWIEERTRLQAMIDGLQAKITEREAAEIPRIASRWLRIRAAWRGK